MMATIIVLDYALNVICLMTMCILILQHYYFKYRRIYFDIIPLLCFIYVNKRCIQLKRELLD